MLNLSITNIAFQLHTSHLRIRNAMLVNGEMKSIYRYQIIFFRNKYLNGKFLAAFQLKWQWCSCFFFSPSSIDLRITHNIILWQSWINMQSDVIVRVTQSQIYCKSVRDRTNENYLILVLVLILILEKSVKVNWIISCLLMHQMQYWHLPKMTLTLRNCSVWFHLHKYWSQVSIPLASHSWTQSHFHTPILIVIHLSTTEISNKHNIH